MSLKGVGMLCTRMDVDSTDVVEFNRWLDKEHMEERVRIPGFLGARRYVAITGAPKYLNLYETESLNVFDGPDYRQRLANQTPWSMKVMAKFKNFHRAVGQMGISQGFGHGAFVAFIWLKPVDGQEKNLRGWFASQEFPELIKTDDILSAHVLESDPRLSGPPPGVSVPERGDEKANDWFVIVEGTDAEVVSEVYRKRFASDVFQKLGTAFIVSSGLFALRSFFEIRNGVG
jgi:hypothetical protein